MAVEVAEHVDYGPLLAGEVGFARRARFHQSWWRAVCLQRPRCGHTRLARELGSVLRPEDAAAGLNFTNPAAERLFHLRHAQGWGIDPRTAFNLTSSQALMLNAFGPLAADRGWAARVLQRLLPHAAITAVDAIDIEWAPRRRSEYLGDMTRIDVLIRVQSNTSLRTVAVEVKYIDRFNSRKVAIGASYRALADQSALWVAVDEAFQTPEFNQLLRVHALATMEGARSYGETAETALVVLHHSADLAAKALVDRYRETLTEPLSLISFGWPAWLDAVRETAVCAEDRRVAQVLVERYCCEQSSEAEFQRYTTQMLRVR